MLNHALARVVVWEWDADRDRVIASANLASLYGTAATRLRGDPIAAAVRLGHWIAFASQQFDQLKSPSPTQYVDARQRLVQASAAMR